MTDQKTEAGLEGKSALIPVDELNPALLSAMMGALAEHPNGVNLEEQAKLYICQLAISEGHLNDMEWLEKKISEVKLDGTPLQPTKQASGYQEVEITHTTEVRDDEHLKSVIAKHQIWLDSILNPKSSIEGGRAHLVGISISDKELSSIDLRGADLKESTFKNIDFSGSNLSTADLTKTEFLNCNFQGSRLRRVIFEKTTFEECDLTSADLKGAPSSGVKWENCTNSPNSEASVESDASDEECPVDSDTKIDTEAPLS